MNVLLKQASFKVRNHKVVQIGVCWSRIFPKFRTDDVRMMFEESVENFCRTAGGSDSADSKVESADIWVRGIMAGLVRKLQFRSRSDVLAVKEDPALMK